MNWSLDNGELRHTENPNTFELPEAYQRKSLVPGMFAKLVFLSEDSGGERMWVRVKEVADNGNYVGSLDNHPCMIEGLEYGDLVAFKPENVIDIHVID